MEIYIKTYEDLSGARFGRWTVLYEADPDYRNGRRLRRWYCRCDCGAERSVNERLLKNGSSKSCGCYHSDVMREVGKCNITHGMTDTRLYRIYRHMIGRCYNEHDIRYPYYGARGITVCAEWSKFDNFAKWALENGYNDELSIDRIDVNGNYTPDNCKWSTVQEQSLNKTNTHYIEFNGVKKSIAEWAREYGMPYKRLHKRIRDGWSPERALLT